MQRQFRRLCLIPPRQHHRPQPPHLAPAEQPIHHGGLPVHMRCSPTETHGHAGRNGRAFVLFCPARGQYSAVQQRKPASAAASIVFARSTGSWRSFWGEGRGGRGRLGKGENLSGERFSPFPEPHPPLPRLSPLSNPFSQLFRLRRKKLRLLTEPLQKNALSRKKSPRCFFFFTTKRKTKNSTYPRSPNRDSIKSKSLEGEGREFGEGEETFLQKGFSPVSSQPSTTYCQSASPCQDEWQARTEPCS